MKRSDFRHLERLRVRWAEVDLQKIVFNGHYLMYFDTAVAGYWRALAMPYHETMAMLGGDLFVRKATVEYLGSARYDELCEVGIRCARIGTSSILFSAALFRGEQLLVSGELVYVFADPASQTSRPVPQDLRDVLTAFEAGETMFDLRLGSWEQLGAEAKGIRHAVFVDEQKIPADMVCDDADTEAVHAVAVNRFGLPLASGRLVAHAPGLGKIGRMAVLAAQRGSGVGRAVLEALAGAAHQRGEAELMLHAQASAVAFYRRAGFVNDGAAFQEAGIEHQAMRRTS
ncbi:MAG: YbgC/FadM family acyl-CoA thioesterase [Rubrivivax sp.]|nr:YbgC/FadM family acyl-CoA thioesterase [Rubrivivax sp.]